MSCLHRWGRSLAVPMVVLCGPPPAAAGGESDPLTLAEAEQIALASDPLVAQYQAQRQAFSERSIAAGQLPDPELTFGLAGVPLDDFDLGVHKDTEAQLGLSQAFPPGRTRRFSRERMVAMAAAEQAREMNERLLVSREVRAAYIEASFEREVLRILDVTRTVYDEMADIAEREYARGRGNQHDVTRAQLELSLIEDRIEQVRGDTFIARAELAKWIGQEHASRPLPAGSPELPAPAQPQDLRARVAQHPILSVDDAMIEAAEKSVVIAEQQYKPQWMVDLMVAENTGGTFSQRPGPDFAGVLVKMSLPIFREKRQDRQLAASRQEAMAARHGRDDRLRELTRQAETEYTNLVRLERRLALYRQRAAAEADQTEEAALNAYQNGLIDFESLARARALVLDTQLEMLRIAAEAQKSRANLLYLVGESS